MDLKETQNKMLNKTDSPQGPNQSLALILYFVFKTGLVVVSGLSIWLGYQLFIFGVSGETSLIVNAKGSIDRLINAGPGLLFAVGGIVTLIVIAWKDINIRTKKNTETSSDKEERVEVS